MGKSFKILKGLLATALTVILVMTLMPWTALADSVIDRAATGTLSIDLKYGSTNLSGGVFDLYYVANLNDSPVLSYMLTSNFAEAATRDGVDINSVKTASQLENTASVLKKYISNAKKAASVTTQNGTASVSGLALGVYLVVQSGAPVNYSAASPFLVYIPMTNASGTGWDYDYTATPKVSYIPPFSNTVNVQVVKVWDDTGNESKRPASIEAGLYRNGTLYDTQTLSAANSWKYVWNNMSSDYSWAVSEINVPDNYFCLVNQSGQQWTLTNVYQAVPLSTTLNVTKEWVGDSQNTRPDSVSVNLLCDGQLYDTVSLTAADSWKYSWVGLDPRHVWSITEPNVPNGYTSSVETVSDGFVIKNTYSSSSSGGTITIPDNNIPKAPQTGLLQWPIPVLLFMGMLLVVSGVMVNHRKKKYDK